MECHLPLSQAVRLLDISAGGVLLLGDTALAVGRSADLQAILGPGLFRARIRVCRIDVPRPESGQRGVLMGAAFESMDPASHAVLLQFLGEHTS